MSAEPRPERSRIALHASDRPRRPWEHRDWTADALRTNLNAKGIAGARLREFAADFGEYVRTLGVDHEQEAP